MKRVFYHQNNWNLVIAEYNVLREIKEPVGINLKAGSSCGAIRNEGRYKSKC